MLKSRRRRFMHPFLCGLPTDDRLGQVVSLSELESRRGEWKRNGAVVVCVVGRFDLLHPGHVRLLEQARGLGDVLIAGVLADSAERAMDSAPGDSEARSSCRLTPAAERAEILGALAAVDYAAEIGGDAGSFLRALAPEVIVEGSSLNAATSLEAAKNPRFDWGAKIVRVPLEPGYSTAAIIERILHSPT